MKRNHFLDVLKGICILLVILTHFKWEKEQALNLLFPFWMNPAVPIFMIISGFVYSESFKRKQVSTFKEAYSVKGVVDKIIRYTIPVAMIYVVEIFLKIFVINQKIAFREILWNFLLGGYGPGSYYFPYMIQFVFLFPLIFFVIKKWDFLGLIFCGAVNLFYEVIKVPLGLSGENFRLLLLRYIFAIALGCFFSIGKFQIKKWMGILSFIIGTSFIYFVCYVGYRPMYFYRWSKTCMLAVLYIAPIAYVLIKKCTLRFKPLEILGQASYNIFLVQMVIFHVMGQLYAGVEASFLPMLITYISCIVLGLLFYKIETPITKKVLGLNARM
jgi:peptidoglycan/LPS O-acetylase OafA/YrhL